MCWEGEFVEQSRASLVEDLYPDPCDLSIWFMGDIVRRNKMVVTVRGLRVNIDVKSEQEI